MRMIENDKGKLIPYGIRETKRKKIVYDSDTTEPATSTGKDA
jgi:hypothetical protein